MSDITTSVLIAEPSGQYADIFRERLNSEYDTRFVENGEDCLDAIAEKIPDILIIEPHLPGIDGFDVCKKLRVSNLETFVPVIFVSETSDRSGSRGESYQISVSCRHESRNPNTDGGDLRYIRFTAGYRFVASTAGLGNQH